MQWSPADSLSQGHGAENLGRAYRTEHRWDLSRVSSGHQSPDQQCEASERILSGIRGSRAGIHTENRARWRKPDWRILLIPDYWGWSCG